MTRFANIAKTSSSLTIIPIVLGKKVLVWGLHMNSTSAGDVNIRSTGGGTNHVGIWITNPLGMSISGHFRLPIGTRPWFVTDPDTGLVIQSGVVLGGCVVYDYIDNDEDLATK